MQAFAEGAVDLLAATVVIEVGINVPNATVMIIENSERFGLAQLHQLRGRVGRGEHPSYCFLITDSKAELGRPAGEDHRIFFRRLRYRGKRSADAGTG